MTGRKFFRLQLEMENLGRGCRLWVCSRSSRAQVLTQRRRKKYPEEASLILKVINLTARPKSAPTRICSSGTNIPSTSAGSGSDLGDNIVMIGVASEP